MSLTIIITAYNEEKTIREVIDRLYLYSKDCEDFEIIAVNDGSTDNTQKILNDISQNYKNITIIELEKNIGKTSSIKKAMELASKEYLVIQDADLEYNPRDLFEIYKKALKNNYDAIYGSRILKQNETKYPLYLFGSRFITKYYNFIFRDNLTDITTAYKLFKRNLIDPGMINEKRFGFCPKITCLLKSKNVKIEEYPISYFPRTIEEGKKVRPKDGFHFLWIITKSYLQNIL